MRIFRSVSFLLILACARLMGGGEVLRLEIKDSTPSLIVKKAPNRAVKVELADHLLGPWTTWNHLAVITEGVASKDLRPSSDHRFSRAVAEKNLVVHAGFVWIEPGTFVIGSPLSEPDRELDEVQHTVTLTQGFWLSDHEVTQAEYLAVMGINPSRFRGLFSGLPVETVSWDNRSRQS